MGFLKKFFRNVFHEGAPTFGDSSFEHLSEEELEAHLGVARYGNFTLTDAVRPSYDLKVVPTQGYRHDRYHDEEAKTSVPVLMAAASSDCLFEVFMDLLDPLGTVVDVVLETSHNRDHRGTPTCIANTSTCRCSRASSGTTRTCCSTTAAPAWPCSIRPSRRRSSSTSTSW